jgi:lysophospholipase L1-like esterase
MIRRWRELLLAVTSVLLATLIAEGVFRLYLRHRSRAELVRVRHQTSVTRVETCNLGDIIRLSSEPDLFYELKPNVRGHFCRGLVATNALGMRMTSLPSLEKPTGVVRIVGLGDSYLFGQGVDDGQGYLEVLGEAPLAGGQRVETLNFGVPGYNAWMEGVVLATRARQYAPDVIVVGLTGNDWDLPGFMLSRPYGDWGHSFLLGALVERFRAPPAVVSTPRSRVDERRYLTVPEEVPEAFRHMVGFDGYRRALARMLEVATELGAPLVLFSDCVSLEGRGGTSCTFRFAGGEYERVRDEVYNHPLVSLCPWQLSDAQLIPGDGHPNAEGHRSLARQLRVCVERVVAREGRAPARKDRGLRLPITSLALVRKGYWPVEQGASGAFAWTQDHADLAVQGLVPGLGYRVTLGIVDSAGRSHITLVANDGASDELNLHGAGAVVWPRTLVAGGDGTLRWSLKVDPWRPKDRVPGAADERQLGVAMNEIVVEEAPVP